jgi:ABC-type cobalamin/Fe3+-siderophores transport system ATPase subunit
MKKNCIKSSARKEVYVLLGGNNCGKSSIIKEIYRILSIKYPNCIIPNKNKKYGYDMRTKMKIISGIEDTLIGIDSSGDMKPHIKTSLSDFVKKGCNIIFCAESLSNYAQLIKHSKDINSILQKTVTGTLSVLKQYKILALHTTHLQETISKKNSNQAIINYEVAKGIIEKARL